MDAFICLPAYANVNIVSTLQTSMTLISLILLRRPMHAYLHSSLQAFCIPHPATSSLQPRCQALADKLAHAVNNGVDHRRMTMTHAVYCQGTSNSIQGDHLPPGHTFETGGEKNTQHSHREWESSWLITQKF